MKKIIIFVCICCVFVGAFLIKNTYCNEVNFETPSVANVPYVEAATVKTESQSLLCHFIPGSLNGLRFENKNESEANVIGENPDKQLITNEVENTESSVNTNDTPVNDTPADDTIVNDTTVNSNQTNNNQAITEEKSIDYFTLKRNFGFYGGKLPMSEITEITFTNIKPDNYDETWLANKMDTNDIVGYRCGSKIYIVGEKIYFNPMSKYMFAGKNTHDEPLWSNLQIIHGLDFVNTSLVENMSKMFYGNLKLTELDLNFWNVSNVSDMSLMFAHCFNLEKLYVEQWDVSNVRSFKAMFQGNSHAGDMNLSFIDVSNWNTSRAVDMGHMFYGCGKLKHIDVSNWNVKNVTSYTHMFADCFSLQSLDILNWETHSVITFDAFLNDCHSLITIDVSGLDTKTCRQFSQMFEACKNLETIIGIENLDVSSASEYAFSEMFHACSALKSLDLSNWETHNADNFARMFKNCSSLSYLNLSGFDVSSLETVLEMFTGINPQCEVIGIENWNLENVNGYDNMY